MSTPTDAEARVAQALVAVLSERAEHERGLMPVLAAVARALVWDVAAFWTPDRATEQLRCEAVWSDMAVDRFESACRATLFPPGSGLPGRVWEHGRAVWVEEVSSDPNFLRGRAASACGLRSALALPITASGRFIGVLECLDRQARPSDDAVLSVAEGLGALLGTFLERGQDDEERTRLLEDVQTERARVQAVLRQLPLGVVITDATNEVILANDLIERVLGPRSTDGSYHIDQIVNRRVVARSLPTVGDLSTGGPITDEELEVRTADGSFAVLSMSAVPVHDRQGQIVSAVTTLVDITERQAERSRFQLLAEAGDILASSLDIDEMLQAIARVTVPRLADHSIVHLIEADGAVRRVAAEFADSSKQQASERLDAEYAPDLLSPEGIARVLRSGKPAVYLDIDEDDLRRGAKDQAHYELMSALGLRAAVIVPLVGRGRTLGALTFASLTSERRFGPAEVDLAVELGLRAGLAVTNAQLYERSRQIADALQSSLLPPSLPVIDGLDLGAEFLAGGEGLIVGGDFYDVYPLDDGRWSIIIGDVCGTGAEAAAITARVRYTARAVEERSAPAALLGRLNSVLRDEGDEQWRFCTVVHGVMEHRGDALDVTLASGGHPAPLVVRTDGRIEAIDCPGALLGVFDSVEHSDAQVELAHGDALVLFTDGVIEARGGSGFFGDAALHDVLEATIGWTAQQIATAVGEAVLDHTQGGGADDVAVLVVRNVPPEVEP